MEPYRDLAEIVAARQIIRSVRHTHEMVALLRRQTQDSLIDQADLTAHAVFAGLSTPPSTFEPSSWL